MAVRFYYNEGETVRVPKLNSLAAAVHSPPVSLSIEEFGITGYDTVDEAKAALPQTSQINAAIAAAAAAKAILYMPRFYPVDGQINWTVWPVLGSGRETSGLVCTTASNGFFHLIYGADLSAATLTDFAVWHKVSTTGSWAGVRFERCDNINQDTNVYGGRTAGTHWVDCINSTAIRHNGGGHSLADYTADNVQFFFVAMDGCTNCHFQDSNGQYCSFGFNITGDDAWSKSYFTASATTDELTIQDPYVFASFATGQSCFLIEHGGGVVPTGLTASDIRYWIKGGPNNDDVTAAGGTVYWMIKTATGIKLATSYANAIAGTAINLTTSGTTGDGLTQISRTLRTTTTVVNTTTDEITVAADFYAMVTTGDAAAPAWFKSGGNLAAPLANDTTYYVIKTVTPNVIKLATSNANALAGTAINLTSNASGLMILFLGPTENISQNDHVSYRPMSDMRNNTFRGCSIDHYRGHAFNISTGYNNWGIDCTASNNDEGIARNAFQHKHSYGDGTDMNGYAFCKAIRCGSGFGCQAGRASIFIACTVDDCLFYPFFVNGVADTQIINPIVRCGGQAADTKTNIMFWVNDSRRLTVSGGNYEPAPNGKTRFAYLQNSSFANFVGGPTWDNAKTWAGGIYADTNSAGYFIDGSFKGFSSAGAYHYIAAPLGFFGHTANIDFPTDALRTIGVGGNVRSGFNQVIRWTMTAVGTVNAATRIRCGRMGSAGAMVPAIQPPATAGAKKDYLGACKPSSISTATNVLTVPADFVTVTVLNTIVRVSSPTGSLPGGLSEATDYFVIPDTSTTIKLAASAGGAEVDITSVGASDMFMVIKAWVPATALAAECTVVGAGGESVMLEASWIPQI